MVQRNHEKERDTGPGRVSGAQPQEVFAPDRQRGTFLRKRDCRGDQTAVDDEVGCRENRSSGRINRPGRDLDPDGR